MRLTWVVSCVVFLSGCGRFGFGGDNTIDGGPGDNDGPPMAGDGGLPASCATAARIICDDFERELSDLMGAWDGENDAAGTPTLTTAYAQSGTTSFNVHLDADSSARALVYKSFAPTSVHLEYAARFSTMPDRTVYLPAINYYQSDVDYELIIFPNYNPTVGLRIEAEIVGPDGVVSEVENPEIPLPLGRWFTFSFDLDASTPIPVLTVAIDGAPALLPIDGPFIRDPFMATSGSISIGTGFSEGGSPLDYQLDDVAILTIP